MPVSFRGITTLMISVDAFTIILKLRTPHLFNEFVKIISEEYSFGQEFLRKYCEQLLEEGILQRV